MSTGSDGFKFSNISATTAPFSLLGGEYAITAVATWGGGSVTLEILAADNTTYVPVLVAITANSFATLDLPAGTYKLVVATATAIYVAVQKIPT